MDIYKYAAFQNWKLHDKCWRVLLQHDGGAYSVGILVGEKPGGYGVGIGWGTIRVYEMSCG